MKYKQHYHVSSHPFLSDINFAIMRSHDAQLIICFKNLTANVQTALQRTVPAKGKINNKKKLKKKNKQNKNIKSVLTIFYISVLVCNYIWEINNKTIYFFLSN